MKRFCKAYVVSKMQKGRRLYQKSSLGEWVDNMLDAFFYSNKENAVESMRDDMRHWQPYCERNKIPVHWEILEVEMKVNKIEI